MSRRVSVFHSQRQPGRAFRSGWCCVLAVLVLAAGQAPAETIKGVFQKLTAAQDALTLQVRGTQRRFALTSEVKVTGLFDIPLKDGLDSRLFRRPGLYLAVKTARRAGREVVTEIVVLRRGGSPVYSKP